LKIFKNKTVFPFVFRFPAAAPEQQQENQRPKGPLVFQQENKSQPFVFLPTLWVWLC
jgi:hypothetical protein